MGKKKTGRKAVNHRARGGSAVMAHRWNTNDARHRKDGTDDFPSPPWCVRALIETVLPILRVDRLGVVAEPCCGRKIMAEVLEEYARRVIASDKLDYGFGAAVRDYDDWDVAIPRVDWTITNPPFSLALSMTMRALLTSRRGVAIFERIQWLEGDERYTQLYRPTPPTLVALFVERVPLVRGRWNPKASTATCYAWLVWLRGPDGRLLRPRPPFWIPPGQKVRLTRADDAERFAWRTNKPKRHAALTSARR